MRWLLSAVLLLMPLSVSAEEKDSMGLTESERQEMRLCTSLKDYEQAVEEVASLSAESTQRDVDFALEAVEEEWRDVEHDAEDYEAVQTTQLARSAEQLDSALQEFGADAQPEQIEQRAGPVAEQTLQQVSELAGQVECSKPVDRF
jgi:tRNA nucleotidyltransferase/poly(A) polymerase